MANDEQQVVELPDVDAGADPAGGDAGDESYADDLAATLDEAKGVPPGAEADDGGYSKDLAAEIDQQRETEASADAEAAWRKELAGLVEPHRAALNSVNKGKKEAIRRLFRAEGHLRADPAGALAWLSSAYAGDDAQKAAIASNVLQSLGYSGAHQLAEHERSELRQWREFRTQHEHAVAQQAQQDQATWAHAARTLEEFAPKHPHFETVRYTMAGLMQSGDAADLSTAYRMACQLRGLAPDPAAAAKSASEAQRLAVERARNARTPRTSSVPVPPEDEDEGLSTKDLLRFELRKAAASR